MEKILKEPKLITPSPARLAESLRDTGYTVNTAVADILDNSVSAGATRISIMIGNEIGGVPLLMIADNGCGMNEQELEKALMYGSPSRPSAKSLGKFGMGLKTASTSVCRKLTVISSKNGSINARQWDLDLIKEKDQWLLKEPSISEYADQLDFLNSIKGNGNGTVVIWENLDRLTRGYVQGTTKMQMETIIKGLRSHLSGIFYNFLEKGNSYQNVELEINSVAVEPWDPFCRWLNNNGHDRLEIHDNKPLKFIRKNEDGTEEPIGEFSVNIYILPKQTELSDEELKKSRYGLDNQGFHVFREGRMIESGGWPNRLFVKEPHLNLIRVELVFDHRLDDYFQIDIKKSRIDLPKDIRDTIKKMLAPARNEANRRYRTGASAAKKSLAEQHDKSSAVINKHHEENTSGSVVDNLDKTKGEVDVRNQFGTTRIKIEFDDKPGRLVQARSTLPADVLWMPALVHGNQHAVLLNEQHEFYKRLYSPLVKNPAQILAIDSLLWSLAEAEFAVLSPSVKRNLEEMRIKVSVILKSLAEELPEIEESENNEED